MTHGTSTQPAQPTPAPPAPIAHHWVMTIQTSTGRQGTNNGLVDVTPGVDTDETTYTTVLDAMKEWIGHENTTVLFYRLSPNDLPRPA